MGHNSSVAANLKPEQRKQLFIEMQSSSQTVTAIANREGVSRSLSVPAAAERKSSVRKRV